MATVVGLPGGAQKASVTTTEVVLDLSVLANKRVTIWCDDQDIQFCFTSVSTGGTLVTYTADQAASLTALVSDRLGAGVKAEPRLVLNISPYLVVRTFTGTADVHVKVVGDGE